MKLKIKEVRLFNKVLVPRFLMENFRSKLKLEEIKDELMNNIDIDHEKKLTPSKIKEELDKYVVGQEHVKKAISISLSKKRTKFYRIQI